jgi:hypothetical protein
MGLEVATLIHQLDPANPVGGTDPKSQGDDHIRMIKATLQNTFPNIDDVIIPTHTELNFIDGLTSSAQNQLNGKLTLAATTETFSGTLGISGRFNFGSTHKICVDNGAGLNVRNNADTLQIFHISNGGVITAPTFRGTNDSGTYTPVLTNIANATALSNVAHKFARVNNIVTVTGRFACTPFASGVNTVIDIALPIASNFAGANDAIGTGLALIGAAANNCDVSSTASDVLRLSFVSTTASPTSGFVSYTAQYQII